MQDEKPTDNSMRLRVLLWALVLLAIPVAFFYLHKTEPEPPPQILVPLGSNVATKGATYYNPENRKTIGTILDTSNAHEFDDGTIRPGVLVRPKKGAEVWVPQETWISAIESVRHLRGAETR